MFLAAGMCARSYLRRVYRWLTKAEEFLVLMVVLCACVTKANSESGGGRGEGGEDRRGERKREIERGGRLKGIFQLI